MKKILVGILLSTIILGGCSTKKTTEPVIDTKEIVQGINYDEKEGLKLISLNLNYLDDNIGDIDGNRCIVEISQKVQTETSGMCKTENNTFFYVSTGLINKTTSLLIEEFIDEKDTVQVTYQWVELEDSLEKVNVSLWKTEGDKTIEFKQISEQSQSEEIPVSVIE